MSEALLIIEAEIKVFPVISCGIPMDFFLFTLITLNGQQCNPVNTETQYLFSSKATCFRQEAFKAKLRRKRGSETKELERETHSFISVFLRSSLPWGAWPRRTPQCPWASELFRAQQSSLYPGVSAALGFIICSFILDENAATFDHLSCNFSSGSSSITVPGPP